MFLYNFLSIFSWLESKSLKLIMSLKKVICSIFNIILFNISHLYVQWNYIQEIFVCAPGLNLIGALFFFKYQ